MRNVFTRFRVVLYPIRFCADSTTLLKFVEADACEALGKILSAKAPTAAGFVAAATGALACLSSDVHAPRRIAGAPGLVTALREALVASITTTDVKCDVLIVFSRLAADDTCRARLSADRVDALLQVVVKTSWEPRVVDAAAAALALCLVSSEAGSVVASLELLVESLKSDLRVGMQRIVEWLAALNGAALLCYAVRPRCTL